jgi:hypothetical protein
MAWHGIQVSGFFFLFCSVSCFLDSFLICFWAIIFVFPVFFSELRLVWGALAWWLGQLGLAVFMITNLRFGSVSGAFGFFFVSAWGIIITVVHFYFYFSCWGFICFHDRSCASPGSGSFFFFFFFCFPFSAFAVPTTTVWGVTST